MQNLRDSLFLLYSHPISTVPEEILFLYDMNRHYYMLIPSWYLDISFLQITNWIRNWRVNVSLSMWLYTVRIRAGINFMKDLGFRALVGVVQDHFDDLCWRIYIYIYLRYDLIDCVRPANSNRYGRGKYTEKEVIFDLISQWSGPVSPFSYDELMNCWHQSYILFLWTGGKVGAQREEDCTTRERRGQPVPKRQHGFWKCSCTLTSIQIKKYFHPRRSIFAR